jgi:hypothetical protein
MWFVSARPAFFTHNAGSPCLVHRSHCLFVHAFEKQMLSEKQRRKIKRAKAMGVNPGDIQTSSSEDDSDPGRKQAASSRLIAGKTVTLADKFSTLPVHANRFEMLAARRKAASEAAKREFDEKLADAQLKAKQLQELKDKAARTKAAAAAAGVAPGDGKGDSVVAAGSSAPLGGGCGGAGAADADVDLTPIPRSRKPPTAQCPVVPCQKDQIRRVLSKQNAVYATIVNKRSHAEVFWTVPKPRGMGVPPVSQLSSGAVLREDPEYA